MNESCHHSPQTIEAGGGTPQTTRLRRWLQKPLLLMGLVCVLLALLGIFLPLLPTTPFLLLAAFCFERSSPRLHRWLFANRLFGDFLRRYRNGEGMPLRGKVLLLGLLWLSLGLSMLKLLSDHGWGWPMLLLAIGGAVSLHLLRIPTRR